MNQHKNIQVYLNDILESIEAIERHTADMSFDEFADSVVTQDAVFRRLEIIGEAASNVQDAVHDEYPEVPWRKIIGMRNKLIHEYSSISLEMVWDVIGNNLQPLKKEVEKIKIDKE